MMIIKLGFNEWGVDLFKDGSNKNWLDNVYKFMLNLEMQVLIFNVMSPFKSEATLQLGHVCTSIIKHWGGFEKYDVKTKRVRIRGMLNTEIFT